MTVPQNTSKCSRGKSQAKPSQQLIDIIQAHRSVPPEVDDGMKKRIIRESLFKSIFVLFLLCSMNISGTDLEAALDSLTEQVEVDAVDAFDDDAEFVVAEIFLSERRKKLKFDHLVSIL